MNIFALSIDPCLAAQYLVDKHCIKMIVESAQMLANCFDIKQLSDSTCPLTAKNTIRKHSFVRHPCSLWVRKSIGNAKWLIEHAFAIEKERLFRFENSKQHFCIDFIIWCKGNIESADLISRDTDQMTEFAQAMPEEFMNQDPILAYRNYYRIGKKHLHCWTRRKQPSWINEC